MLTFNLDLHQIRRPRFTLQLPDLVFRQTGLAGNALGNQCHKRDFLVVIADGIKDHDAAPIIARNGEGSAVSRVV